MIIIQNITTQLTPNHAVLSADILVGGKAKQMYFAVDKAYATSLQGDASPFLAALLLPAMQKGEDIRIEGSVSRKLYEQTGRIMQLVASWQIGCHLISITAKTIKPDKLQPEGVGCFFSGGVDSFYSFLTHQKEITHLLFIHGFDITLTNQRLYYTMRSGIEQVAKETEKTLICVETNSKAIVEELFVWDYSHGGATAAVALTLRALLQRVYIPSSVPEYALFPYGTHPLLDGLWSTESLTFIHDGNNSSRQEKISDGISHSPLALAHLHVCAQNTKGVYNCSRCFKCVRTMIELYIAGSLDRANTFKHHFPLSRIKQFRFDIKMGYGWVFEEYINTLRKQNRHKGLQQALAYSLKKSQQPSFARRMQLFLAYIDRRFLRRLLYRLVFQMTDSQDRNWLFKYLVKQGVIT